MTEPTREERIAAAHSMAFDILGQFDPGDCREALTKMMVLCDALERAVETTYAVSQVVDLRHWATLTYGGTETGHSPQQLKAILGNAIGGVKQAAQSRL